MYRAISSWRTLISSSFSLRMRATMATIVETRTDTDVQPLSFPCVESGRKFYESIGSPRYVVAPMVDRSEFAWRMLTRSYMGEEDSKKLLAYTPMLHARLFQEQARFRDEHFQPTKQSLISKEASSEKPYLDGNPEIDRPLFVQFCANKPDEFLEAASYVAPYCDAVDLNLGCPQGIAKSGKYGAFLQEDWDTIYKLINRLHKELSVPVTAKMRILDTKEKTLDYARMILSAGASILTVHGRRREQKGHNTGLADWQMIRYLRDNLPPQLVLFANGNILNSGDLDGCLEATGADAIMSAEGNLQDPTIFAKPPSDSESREYWRGPNGKGGYRIDGVLRRYLDIVYKYVLEKEPPKRAPLYIPSDPEPGSESTSSSVEAHDGEPPSKKRKKDNQAKSSPSLKFMSGHLFGFLKILFQKHTDIRDVLQKTRPGDMAGFEKILAMVEDVTKKALQEEAKKFQTDSTNTVSLSADHTTGVHTNITTTDIPDMTPSQRTALKYGRPWWVCQPHVRPLPEEAIKIGAMTISKKDKAKMNAANPAEGADNASSNGTYSTTNGTSPSHQQEKEARSIIETEIKAQEVGAQISRTDDDRKVDLDEKTSQNAGPETQTETAERELPKEALVCG